MDQNKHNEQPIKRKTPKALEIERRKEIFLEALRANGGVVSDALEVSGLKRTVAYNHFREDSGFADEWIAALETGLDALYKEAKRRAVEGIEEPVWQNGKIVGTTKRYSDTLLIFLLKQGDYQKRWRNRVIQTGHLAVQSVAIAAKEAELSESQVSKIQEIMVEEFGKITI